MKDRKYKEGVPQHVYFRGIGGGVIFYCIRDCIYYVTLYTCLAEKHRITTTAFSLMPNHSHSQQKALSHKSFSAFNGEFSAVFTRGYNRRHNRSGELFDNPFGSAPKPTGKLIKSNLSYICNNGAEGKLSKGVLDYQWNLMAYYHNPSPFSQRIRKDLVSKRLRDAVNMVDYFRKAGKPLGYNIQEILFKKLDKKEKKQLIDYILYKYNPLDYSGIESAFGSFAKALAGMEANCGSEYDIKEDWDDYSVYSELGSATAKKGVDLQKVNFEAMDIGRLLKLRSFLKQETRATERQLDKFLHANTRNWLERNKLSINKQEK